METGRERGRIQQTACLKKKYKKKKEEKKKKKQKTKRQQKCTDNMQFNQLSDRRIEKYI